LQLLRRHGGRLLPIFSKRFVHLRQEQRVGLWHLDPEAVRTTTSYETTAMEFSHKTGLHRVGHEELRKAVSNMLVYELSI
jgi:hypothetical protein